MTLRNIVFVVASMFLLSESLLATHQPWHKRPRRPGTSDPGGGGTTPVGGRPPTSPLPPRVPTNPTDVGGPTTGGNGPQTGGGTNGGSGPHVPGQPSHPIGVFGPLDVDMDSIQRPPQSFPPTVPGGQTPGQNPGGPVVPVVEIPIPGGGTVPLIPGSSRSPTGQIIGEGGAPDLPSSPAGPNPPIDGGGYDPNIGGNPQIHTISGDEFIFRDDLDLNPPPLPERREQSQPNAMQRQDIRDGAVHIPVDPGVDSLCDANIQNFIDDKGGHLHEGIEAYLAHCQNS